MSSVAAEPIVKADATGVLRVAKTRVPLDTVVAAYVDGASAEEIALRYESLSLPDVYDAISYYLRHQTEVDTYLAARRVQAQKVRKEVESRQGLKDIRAMLMARREAKESLDALPGR